jgi:hypothetical protein
VAGALRRGGGAVGTTGGGGGGVARRWELLAGGGWVDKRWPRTRAAAQQLDGSGRLQAAAAGDEEG